LSLWVFKRHFSTIFQLYIDLWATLPGANMVQGRNTLGYLRTRTFYIPAIGLKWQPWTLQKKPEYIEKKSLGQKKNMCVSDCMVFEIRVGRSGHGYLIIFFKRTLQPIAVEIRFTVVSCHDLRYFSGFNPVLEENIKIRKHGMPSWIQITDFFAFKSCSSCLLGVFRNVFTGWKYDQVPMLDSKTTDENIILADN
jgi:hypothetical protein